MNAEPPIPGSPGFPAFEEQLRERWYRRPALSVATVRSLWGEGKWPMIVRYRVLCLPGNGGREYTESHVTSTLADARRYAADLRRLGVGRGALSGRALRIRRSKLAPGHVLVRVHIRRFMRYYEPPQHAAVVALLYRPSGRVVAYYELGEKRHFDSLAGCLAYYRRDAAWLAEREAFHLAAG